VRIATHWLYKQGLRDFRGSNLNSFYLSQVLTEQAISEIDLKLKGAHVKKSSLRCLSEPRARRALLNTAQANCAINILFQSEGVVQEKKIVLDDIESIAKSAGQTRYVLKETTIDRPLFIFGGASEVNFYWGYQADEETLMRAFVFTRDSITASGGHENIQIRFYLFQRFNDNRIFIEFVRKLGGIGFSDVKLHYYTSQTEFFAVHFKNDVLSVAAARQIVSEKIRSFLNVIKLDRVSIQNKEGYRDRLRRITLEVKRKAGSGLRAAGRKGVHYQIGAGILQLTGRAINHPGTLEPQQLDEQTKEDLKIFAQNITLEVGRERGASDRLIASVLNLTKSCIDRGECANEELVMKESIHFLDAARSDLMVGNEYMWNETKAFFIKVGDYISSKFDEVKQFFRQNIPNGTDVGYCAVPVCFFSQAVHSAYIGWPPSRHKRKIVACYQSPVLIGLIKEIEGGFEGLGYDLQLDERYSEEILAGILYELWQTLERHNISNHSTPETILSILNDETFIENVVNATLVNSANEDSNSTAIDYLRSRDKRRKRSIDLFTTQQTDEDKLFAIEEHYHSTYLGNAQHARIKQSTTKDSSKLKKNNQREGITAQQKYQSIPRPKQQTATKKYPKEILVNKSTLEKNPQQNYQSTRYTNKNNRVDAALFNLAKKI
jgi:hypothetical protein